MLSKFWGDIQKVGTQLDFDGQASTPGFAPQVAFAPIVQIVPQK